MRIACLRDPEAVNSILQDTAMHAKLVHDARAPGFIEHPLVSYYGAYIDDRLVGVFTGVDFTAWELEVHVAIVPSAIRHARRLCRLYLEEMFAAPDRQRVTAYVLGTLPSAANLCRRLGFVDEGVRRKACRIDGKPVDVIVLGMTRDDLRASAE